MNTKQINKNHIYHTVDVDMVNLLVNSTTSKFVELCEKSYEDKILSIVNTVQNNLSQYKIILLAGPSASGKTTTATILQEQFRLKGIGAWTVSLDDFYLGIKDYPTLPNGIKDYESINALDLPLIRKCLYDLVTCSTAEFPIFEFTTGQRSSLTRRIDVGENDIIILEGLHALNPSIIEDSYAKACLKIYISVSSNFVKASNIIISSQELRLIRRIIRDFKFRGTKPKTTVKFWDYVCAGERLYIDPIKDTADVFIDSCINYEPCVFNNYINDILKNSSEKDEFYNSICMLYNKLCHFDIIDSDYVPSHSIIREFIGIQ